MSRFPHIKSVRLDDDLNGQLREYAQKLSLSDADVFRLALIEYLGDRMAALPRRVITSARTRSAGGGPRV